MSHEWLDRDEIRWLDAENWRKAEEERKTKENMWEVKETGFEEEEGIVEKVRARALEDAVKVQQRHEACLDGKHEAEMDMIHGLREVVFLCKHCRCLFVERG